MDDNKLAELLFPQIKKRAEDYEAMYPARNLPEGAKVTRLGPSPTGFIHLGNLYGAFVDERLAHQSDGIFNSEIEAESFDKKYRKTVFLMGKKAQKEVLFYPFFMPV